MEHRRRLATPELTHWVKKIKKKMTSSPPLGALNDAGPGFRPGYVLRLRLSRRDREMLEVAAADDGGRDTPLPGAGPPRLAEQVAVLLFLRWSFANHALRELLHQLEEIESFAESESSVGSEDAAADAAWAALYGSGNSSTVDKQLRTAKLQVSQLRESFAVGLEIRLDHFLPFDSRRKRVTALLADPDNKGFWDTLPSLYLPDAKTLEENRLDRFAVAPHPADEKIWLGLAYKVIKKHHVMRRWPGVHEAAAFAAQQLGVHDTSPEYPYHDWFSDHLAAAAAGKPHRGRPNAYSRWARRQTNPAASGDVESLAEGFEDLRLSSEHPQYEEEWVETIRASVDAVDVWDIWTLLRMLKCESASQELTNSEQNLLRAAFPQGPSDLTKECPLSILGPKDFVEVARYNSPKYKLHHLTSETLVADCLIHAGHQTTGNWDLVCLEDTQQDDLFPEHTRHFDHHRHAFYLTEDVTSHYLLHNHDLLGLTAPCKCDGCECPEQPDESEIDDDSSHNAHCRFHHGGEVVFARRRLKDTSFAQNLDRYWIDWNDCMLILGRGKDEDGNLIDGGTLYLLETLPGIKLRAMKEKAINEARGLASACLFVNLKIENRFELDQSRSLLQSIMGTRYHPRFKDFTYLIDDSWINWEDALRIEDDSRSYGSTYLALWTQARVWDQQGNVSFNGQHITVRVMAESDQESSDHRRDMFCQELEACYDFLAGNRIKNTVAFLGFTLVPVDSNGKLLVPPSCITTGYSYVEPPADPKRALGLVFEDVGGPFLARITELVRDDVSERDTWVAIIAFLWDIGSALREMHQLVGPYRFIHPDNILYREHRRVPIAAIEPPYMSWGRRRYLLNCEAVIAEPSPWEPPGMERYLAPELRYGQGRHTEATDAYAFAKVALDMITAACEGLYPDLEGFFEEGVRVVYVEVLKGLEDVLGADYVLDFGDGVGGDDEDEEEEEDNDDDDNNDDEDEDMKEKDDEDKEEEEKDVREGKDKKGKGKEKADEGQPSGAASSSGGGGRRRRLGRVEAMENFLRLAKSVVDGHLVLDGHYPVPEWSRWYDFEAAFPCVYQVLASGQDGQDGWFRRDKVLLYWIQRPSGWGQGGDAPSNGSDHDDEWGDDWDGSGWESDSLKSDLTEDSD